MSMAYIRDAYGVPAKRGGRVRFTESNGQKFDGTIRAAKGAHLTVKLDGVRRAVTLHPTWNLEYNVGGVCGEWVLFGGDR